MIDAAAFYNIWARLCRRFNRTLDREEAGDYLAYLERAGFTNATIVEAAEAVWATREFFPRPADFLAPEASAGWTAIREFAQKWTQHLSADDARILIGAVPQRAKDAMDALGGMDAVRTAKDMSRLRKEYFDAFERVIMEESVKPKHLALPAPPVVQLDMPNEGPGRINVGLLKQLAEPVA